MQKIAKIYGTRTGYMITTTPCDQALKIAREIARQRSYPVIVEDHDKRKVYKVTPGGHKSPPPKCWHEPNWDLI
jgi:hypothetical protein